MINSFISRQLESSSSGVNFVCHVLAWAPRGGVIMAYSMSILFTSHTVDAILIQDEKFVPMSPGEVLKSLKSYVQFRGILYNHYGLVDARLHTIIQSTQLQTAGMQHILINTVTRYTTSRVSLLHHSSLYQRSGCHFAHISNWLFLLNELFIKVSLNLCLRKSR